MTNKLTKPEKKRLFKRPVLRAKYKNGWTVSMTTKKFNKIKIIYA